MISLPLNLIVGHKGGLIASIHFLFLLLFLSWSNASPSPSDTRQNSHQNGARDYLPPAAPNYIECTGRAPYSHWPDWPEGVDPWQYPTLKQLCAPIERPSLGFVCPIPGGVPVQDDRYKTNNLQTWPLVKICQERCWCQQPNDPDFSSDEEVGFSGESEADVESEYDSDTDSDYLGSYGSVYEDTNMASDTESVYDGGSNGGGGNRNRQYQKLNPKSSYFPIKQCNLGSGKKCPVIDYPTLPPRCGQRCFSVAQQCSSARRGKKPCKCTAQQSLLDDQNRPLISAGKWIATCVRQHTRASVPVVLWHGGLRKRLDGSYGSLDHVDDNGVDLGVGGSRVPITTATACPCNTTYVSQACCDTTDGLVWESPDKYLGQLDLDLDLERGREGENL